MTRPITCMCEINGYGTQIAVRVIVQKVPNKYVLKKT